MRQSAMSALSLVPISASCSPAEDERSNHPWSYPVLASRFAVSLLSSVAIISIFLRCLLLGRQFATSLSSQSAGMLATSSRVRTLRAPTSLIHRGISHFFSPDFFIRSFGNILFDTVDEVSSRHLRDCSVWRAFADEKVSWQHLLHHWRHLPDCDFFTGGPLRDNPSKKHSSFGGAPLTGRPPDSTPVVLHTARI